MPFQNRVDPFGELLAVAARGTFMGNRGGRIHRANRTLGSRRWASRQWICCELRFKERRRNVWGPGYTELFFLDEVTALAAGHRPCFECRWRDADTFAELWATVAKFPERMRADDMDRVLHAQRLDGRAKRRYRFRINDLPDGAMIAFDDGACAVRDNILLPWTPSGYSTPRSRPLGGVVDVLTPPAIVKVLAAGYGPRWHPSANY
jgi:hypothetical protein